MHTLSLKIPDDLYNQINAATHKQKVQKSKLIREALYRYLGDTPAKASMLDLAQDLCGAVSGTADLSTNPKHFKNYGQ